MPEPLASTQISMQCPHRLQAVHKQPGESWRQQIESYGAQRVQPFAQNRYLETVDARRQGYCRALAAQLMAVWLQEQAPADPQRPSRVEHYLLRLQQATARPDTADARLFELGLLQWSLNPDTCRLQEGASRRGLDAAQVLSQLRQATPPAAYELRCGLHALGVGMSIVNGRRRYALVDPNFGFGEFTSETGLRLALTLQLRAIWALAANAGLLFSLYAYRHDLADQALLPDLSGTLTLADLGRTEDLSAGANAQQPLEWMAAVDQHRQRLLHRERHTQQRLANPHAATSQSLESLALAASLPEADMDKMEKLIALLSEQGKESAQQPLVEIDALDDWMLNKSQMGEEAKAFVSRLSQVTTEMLHGQAHPEEWIPMLDSMRAEENGASSMAFRNRLRPEDVIRRQLPDTRASELKSTLDQATEAMRKTLAGTVPGEEFSSINGLNRAFFVQMVMNILRRRSEAQGEADPATSKSLLLAMQIHDYANMSQIAVGMVEEAQQVVSLVRTALQAEQEGVQLTGLSMSLVSRVASSGLQAAGGVLQAFSVALDIYELMQARSSVQKATIATQLAFDSVGLGLMSAAMIGAASGTALGATVATFAGPAGVLIAGPAIGVSALARNISSNIEKSLALAEHFAAIADACRLRGREKSASYEFVVQDNLLRPMPAQTVISKIDLQRHEVTFGAPKFYRSRNGDRYSAGDTVDLIWWAGFNPQSEAQMSEIDMPRAKAQARAIDMLDRLGCARQAPLPEAAREAHMLVLPAIPQHYVDYNYVIAEGIQYRYDHGIKIMRSMENPKDFLYDVRCWSEYAMAEPTFQYRDSEIEILLRDNAAITLATPPIAQPEISHHLHYIVRAKRGHTKIMLAQHNARFTLHAEHPDECSWMLYSPASNADSIGFHPGAVQIDGVKVALADSCRALHLMLANGDVYQLDVATQHMELQQVNAAKLPTAEQITRHVAHLASNPHTRLEHIIEINDYIVPASDGHAAENVAHAYLDTTDNRLLFLRGDHYPNATLALRNGPDAYFYNHDRSKLLRMDIDTGEVKCRFQITPDGSRQATALLLQKQGSMLLLSDTRQQYVYQLFADQLTLISALVDRPLAQQLEQQDRFGDIKSPLQRVLAAGFSENKQQSQVATGGYIMLHQNRSEAITRRYWLRVDDGAVIRARFGDTAMPLDLMLLAVMADPGRAAAGEAEVVYFYSATQQTVYRQLGRHKQPGTPATSGASTATPFMPRGEKVTRVFGDALGLHVATDAGLVYQLDADGWCGVSAVHGTWLNQQATWWTALAGLPTGKASTEQPRPAGHVLETNANGTVEAAAAPVVTILDLQQQADVAQPAWYTSGKVILAAQGLPASTRLLGLTHEGHYAWLYTDSNRTLYRQSLVDNASIQRLYGSSLLCRDPAALPQAYAYQTVGDLQLDHNTLTVELLDGKLPPPIDGVSQWLLVPSKPMSIEIQQSDWEAVKRIVVDPWQLPQTPDPMQPMQLMLKLKNPLALSASRVGDDLQLLDRANGRLLQIRQQFGAHARTLDISLLLPDNQQRIRLDGVRQALANVDNELWRMMQAFELNTLDELTQLPEPARS